MRENSIAKKHIHKKHADIYILKAEKEANGLQTKWKATQKNCIQKIKTLYKFKTYLLTYLLSTAIRQQYDHSAIYVTTVGLPVAGCCTTA